MDAAPTAPYRIRFTAEPVQLFFLRAGLERWLVGLGWPEDERIDAVLAVSEACANAVRHAYRPGESGEVEVTGQLMIAPEQRHVVFVVRDEGRWRAGTGGGRGLPSLEACMEKVKIRHGERGTAVTMISRPVPLVVPSPRAASDPRPGPFPGLGPPPAAPLPDRPPNAFAPRPILRAVRNTG